MQEKEIEKRLVKLVQDRGGLCWKFTSPACRGVPDRLVITPRGEVWFVELKTETGKLSPLQKLRQAELRQRGAHVCTLWGLSGVLAFAETVLPL